MPLQVRIGSRDPFLRKKGPRLRGEHGEGNQDAEKANGHPVSDAFAEAEVHNDELELAQQGQLAVHDVGCGFAPELHWSTCPAVLLLAECKEAGR